jgi:hypothetical protein
MNPDVLFSADNPFLKSARNTHRLVFDAFDRTARLQLAYAQELLDLNTQRFEALYGSESVMDAVAAQQDLAFDLARSTSRCMAELKEVASGLQASLSDAANEFDAPAKKAAPKTKKAKTA